MPENRKALAKMAYTHRAVRSHQQWTCLRVHGYSFALDSAKTVRRALPYLDNRDVVVLSVDLAAAPVGVATPVSVNLSGTR